MSQSSIKKLFLPHTTYMLNRFKKILDSILTIPLTIHPPNYQLFKLLGWFLYLFPSLRLCWFCCLAENHHKNHPCNCIVWLGIDVLKMPWKWFHFYHFWFVKLWDLNIYDVCLKLNIVFAGYVNRKRCIMSESQFDFLKDLVESVPDLPVNEEDGEGETKPKR